MLSIDHRYVTGKDVKDPGWCIQIFYDVEHHMCGNFQI